MTTISALGVFCGSKTGDDPAFAAAARDLGRIMAARRVRMVYGGGNIGLMGIIADSVLGEGGHVTGVIPDFLMKFEVGKSDVSELIVVDSMHERKRRMFEMADGFVILPGGLGTLDETFEIVTWKQLRQHSKPIVVLNVSGYWDPFIDLVEGAIDGGFAHAGVRDLFTVVETVDGVFEALESAPEPVEEVLTSHF